MSSAASAADLRGPVAYLDDAQQSGRVGRRRLAWPLIPIGIFLATRILDAVFIVLSVRHQIALPDPTRVAHYFVFQATGTAPGYWSAITNWDGQWYQSIATDGYRNGVGASRDQLWGWAFPPLFPLTVGALMRATGLSFAAAATLLNLTTASVGMVLLYDVLRRSGGRALAACGVALLCCFPTAVLFQAAYSESVAFALLMTVFGLLQRRQYWWALLPLLALAMTRIITPPIALVVAFHAWSSWRGVERRLRRPDLAALALLSCASLGGVFLWSTTARLVARGPTGATMRPADLAGKARFGWFSQALNQWGWAGLALVVATVLLVIGLAAMPGARMMGAELRTWLWAYPLYLVSVTQIPDGILRYLLLCPGLALLWAVVGARVGRRRGMVLMTVLGCSVGLALQAAWVDAALIVSTHPIVP